MAVQPITLSDVKVIDGEIKQCLNALSSVKRGKNISKTDFVNEFSNVTESLYREFIAPSFSEKDTDYTEEDEKVYLENLATITTYILNQYPDKLIKIATNQKSKPNNSQTQNIEIRKATKKAVHQLGIIQKATGTFQLIALIGAMCAFVSRNQEIEPSELTFQLKKTTAD